MGKMKKIENVLKAVSALIVAAMSIIKFFGYIDKVREPKAA